MVYRWVIVVHSAAGLPLMHGATTCLVSVIGRCRHQLDRNLLQHSTSIPARFKQAHTCSLEPSGSLASVYSLLHLSISVLPLFLIYLTKARVCAAASMLVPLVKLITLKAAVRYVHPSLVVAAVPHSDLSHAGLSHRTGSLGAYLWSGLGHPASPCSST